MKIELSKECANIQIETQSQPRLGQIRVKEKSSIGPGKRTEKCQIDDLLKKPGLFRKYFWKIDFDEKKVDKKFFWSKFELC